LSPPLRSAGFRDAKRSGGDGGGGGRRLSGGAVGGGEGGGGGVEVAEGGGGREDGSRHLELLMSCPPHQLHQLHQGAESQSFSRPQRFIQRRGQLELKERKEQRCKDGQGGETEKEIVEVVQEREVRSGGMRSVSSQAVSTATRLAHSRSLDSQDDPQASRARVKGPVHVAASSESLSAPESCRVAPHFRRLMCAELDALVELNALERLDLEGNSVARTDSRKRQPQPLLDAKKAPRGRAFLPWPEDSLV
jgi:hypothetical protein